MPYEVRGNDLVPVKDAPSELFVQFDRADEDQIVATMQGAALEEYVYSFEQGGTTVTGLSWVGTREAARHQGGIHISQPQITETEEAFMVMVSAHDRIRDVLVWGGASQAKVQTFRNGGSKPDPFAFQKALSKAQRNAMMAVLPTTVIVKMIDAYRNRQQNVRRVAAEPRESAPAGPKQNGQPAQQPKPYDPAHPPSSGAATDAQVKAIYAIGREKLGMSEDDVEEAAVNAYGSIPKLMTKAEASAMIKALQSGQTPPSRKPDVVEGEVVQEQAEF